MGIYDAAKNYAVKNLNANSAQAAAYAMGALNSSHNRDYDFAEYLRIDLRDWFVTGWEDVANCKCAIRNDCRLNR